MSSTLSSQSSSELPSTLPVVLTGDRPTGPLHLGHYVGSLRNRLELQRTHQQFVLIADQQALTDHAEQPELIRKSVLEVALDYLAVGIDFERTCVCVQSQLPELPELTLYLMNLVTVARLERNPTVRDEIKQRNFERGIPAGFLCYPVSQAADITAFKASLVPVGEDQLPVIEQTNELVRRFNHIYGPGVLLEAKPMLSQVPRLPGIDGRTKMSKSLGNAIFLSDAAEAVRQKVFQMYTDPEHIHIHQPGRVEGNVVFSFLDAFDPNQDEIAALKEHYRRGGLGDVPLKRRLAERLEELLSPIRSRRAEFANDPGEVREMLLRGSKRAREITSHTLSEVRSAIALS
jgi:tryptophanyl-tRNA synthetase